MAKFKCKQSGNIFEFSVEHDIKTMRSHPEYEEVKEKVEHEKISEKKVIVRARKTENLG